MTTDLDSNPPDSLQSTPRSHHHPDDSSSASQRLRFMCSFGGKILPRPHDNQLRYVGGDTRIVSLHRHAATFSSLLSKLSKLTGTTSITIKYQLPNEDLDALITVTSDEDLDNMIEEFDRLSVSTTNSKSPRLRLFLFPTQITPDSRTSSINSLLDGSAKRESWFVDALNGPALDRARSEVSSIVSEVPDYLFGLENSDDQKFGRNNKNHLLNDNVSNSDPGSPAPVVSVSAVSPFCSTSSSLAPVNMVPDLPPVRTKPENEKIGYTGTGSPMWQGTGTGSPMWQYPNPAMQQQTVYYVPNTHVQAGTVPMRAQYVQPYQVAQGQVPVGFPGLGQMYGGQPARIYMENGGQPMYYGARNMAMVPGNYPGMVVSSGEDVQVHGTDRVLQGS